MPPRTPLAVRTLSPTVSFSAYGASAVTRLILKKRAKKWLFFFSDAVATRNGLLLVTPRSELISEQDETPADQPGTIPLVLTYHPTNVLVKNIITRNLRLVRDDHETAAIFSPYAFHVLISVIAAYATLLWDSALDNRTATDNDYGTFPCGRTRCKTCVNTNVSAPIVIPGRQITVEFKYTCLRENVEYAIKCGTCNKAYIEKTGRRLGDRLRERHTPLDYLAPTFPLAATLHPLVTESATCWYRWSVLASEVQHKGAVSRPEWYSEPAGLNVHFNFIWTSQS